MGRIHLFSLFLVLIVFLVSAAYAQSQQQVADTLYTNGKIYTVSEDQPWVEAVTIKDGKFIGKRQRFSPLATTVARCLLHVPGQQSFNLFQRVGRRDVLQYMM